MMSRIPARGVPRSGGVPIASSTMRGSMGAGPRPSRGSAEYSSIGPPTALTTRRGAPGYGATCPPQQKGLPPEAAFPTPSGSHTRPGTSARGKVSLTVRPSGSGSVKGASSMQRRSSLKGKAKQGSMAQVVSTASIVLAPDKEDWKPRPTCSRVEVRTKKVIKGVPLSTMVKGPKKPMFDKEAMKKKLYRRQAPEGEDIKKIKEILRSTKNEEITIQEFVGLIAPYTGDNGEGLRTVLAEDVTAFRNMAKKIYETMTQDVSDVLTNEHVALIECQNEKFEMYTSKMTRIIDEIFELCPDFNFDEYYKNPGQYLLSKFPPPEEEVGDPAEEENRLRQEAFHRLQWLRSEGDRLNEENERLQKRLNEIKREQRKELHCAAEAEKRMEEQKEQLEVAEKELQDRLDDLNYSIDRSLLIEETCQRRRDDQLPEKQKKKVVASESANPRDHWSRKTAEQIEDIVVEDVMEGEVSKVSLHSRSSRPSILRKKPRIKDDLQTSVTKSAKRRSTSPFHYSPDAPLETTRIEKTVTVTEQPPLPMPKPPSPTRRRRCQAPKDTWGGFQ